MKSKLVYHQTKKRILVTPIIKEKDSLSGNDTLYVPSNVVKRLRKNQKLRKGMDIKLAKTNIRKQVGGSLLTSILTLGRTLAPTLGKTLGLSALAGLASEGASQVVKKISGGFLIPQNKIDQLIAHKHLLTDKQKRDILNSVQSGGQLVLKPTKSQYGGFLGTLLASIGIPLAVEAIKKMTGNGIRFNKRSWCTKNWNVSTTSIYRHMGTSKKRRW